MKGLIITLGILGVIAAGIVGLYGYANGLQKQGVAYETSLNKQYLDNQNELGTYISSFYEQVGIANLKSDKMDQILTDAVKGRYEGHTSAQVGQGQLFSAIKEAYPNLDLSVYDRILTFVQQGRQEYKGYQTTLLTQLQSYDQWRKSGLLQSHIVSMLGFPSDALQAHIGSSVVTGAAAEAQMYVIVLPSEAVKAYQTGIQEPLDPSKIK